MKNYDVKTVDVCNRDVFEKACKDYLNDGYVMKSCSCGFIPSDEYNFCASYMAVFVKEGDNE